VHSTHALACIRACAWRVPGISGGRGPPAWRLAWSLPGPGACLARLACARARLGAMRPRSCCHECCHEAVRLCARTMVVLTARPGRGAQERESGETFNVLNTQLTKGELSFVSST
jgi:hypothetical protein